MTSNLKYRADIDGLRAVAVLGVVLYHFFPALAPGGFIGVDIFFVISGFLITGIIQDAVTAGRWNLAEFYSRRIRRILPSLLLMFLVGAVAAHFILFNSEAANYADSVFYGALFWSNVFLRHHSGYFDFTSELQPNLHLWSLAVEEQFYIFWPIILSSFLLPAKKKIVVILCVLSLLYSVFFLHRAPAHVFFYITSRLWELGLGGMLVLFKDRLDIKSPKACSIVSFAGLGLILVTMAFVDKTQPYPGWRAILPTLGAALLILAGPRALLNKIILSLRPLVFVGLISYPLYLWHWPTLYFLRMAESLHPDLSLKIVALGLAFALAIFSYYVLERPIRFKTKSWGLVTWVLIVTNFAFAGWAKWSGLPAHPNPDSQIFAHWHGVDEKIQETCPLTGEIAKQATWCFTDKRFSPNSVVIGDSHAGALFAGLVREGSALKSWTLIGRANCPPLLDVDNSDPVCEGFTQKVMETLDKNPQLHTVLIAIASRELNRPSATLLNGERDITTLSETIVREGLTKFIKAVSAKHRHIAFLIDEPAITEFPQFCISRPFTFMGQANDECHVARAKYFEVTKSYRQLVRDLKLAIPEMTIIDPINLFCSSKDCSVMHGALSNYSYTDHMSDNVSQDVAKLINQEIANSWKRE